MADPSAESAKSIRVVADPATTIEFRPLTFNPDKDDVVISSPASPHHMSLNAEARPLVDRLQNGATLGEVMAEFELDAETAQDLLKCFLDCGLVARVGGHRVAQERGNLRIDADAPAPRPAPRGTTFGLSRIKPASLAFLVSPPAIAFYAACTVFSLATLLAVPALRPRPADWFFSSSMTVSLVGNFVLGWLVVLGHEAAHMLAARQVGLAGTLGIGYRQRFLVAETDVSHIWEVPHRQRYPVFLAGLAYEFVLIAILIALFLLDDAGRLALGPARPVLRALLYSRYVSVLWQFRFNMQTDIYYTVGNLLNHKNLMEDTKAYLGFLWARVRRREAKLPRLRPREWAIVRAYMAFAAVTNTWVWISWVYLIIPVWVRLLWTGGQSVWRGFEGGRLLLVGDGLLVIAITLFNWLTPVVLWWRSRRHTHLAPPEYEVVLEGTAPGPPVYLRAKGPFSLRRTPVGVFLLSQEGEDLEIDETAVSILEQCDGTRRPDQIRAAVLGGEPSAVDRAGVDQVLAVMRAQGILTKEAEPRPVVPFYRGDRPLSLIVEITWACNEACRYCLRPTGSRAPGELSDRVFLDLAEEAGRLGASPLNITGGEPLLKAKLALEMARRIRDAGGYAHLLTNGLLVTRELARELRAAGVRTAQVSLDSTDPAKHDLLRGHEGAHAGALAAIRHLREAGITVNTATVLNRRNWGERQAIGDLARGLADWCKLSAQLPLGRGDNEDILGLKEQIECRLLTMRVSGAGRCEHGDGMLHCSFVPRDRCSIGSSPVVAPDGAIYPCMLGMHEGLELGRYPRDSLAGIWAPGANPLLSGLTDVRVDELEGCRSCEARYFCAGGCRASAYARTGSYRGRDPTRCAVEKVVFRTLLEDGDEPTRALARRCLEAARAGRARGRGQVRGHEPAHAHPLSRQSGRRAD